MRIGALNPRVFALGLSFLISGCGGNDQVGGSGVQDLVVQALIAQHNHTADPMAGRNLPQIQDPLAQLGMRLFFSKSLGGDRDSACVTCHHPRLGGGDDLSLSVGVGADDADLLGDGRTHAAASAHFNGGPTVPRNAPTTFNLAGWDHYLFHDGRVEALVVAKGQEGSTGGIRTPDVPLRSADPNAGANLSVAQARFPVTSPEEMKGHNFAAQNNAGMRTVLQERMGGYGSGVGVLANTQYWLDQFRTAFNSPAGTAQALITYDNIAAAIAAYERSQNFTNAPWKSYVQGNTAAITDDAKRGAQLFFTPVDRGGAGCVSCHSGDFFTDEDFHILAVPQIGRGKGNGTNTDDDFGRFRETNNPNEMYAFRTPTLWNVGVTGPWMHSGAYTTLEATIRHHLDPHGSIQNYNVGQLTQPGIQNLSTIQARAQAALSALDRARAEGRSKLLPVTLADAQVQQLVAFLNSLTDPCVEDPNCIGPWIPDAVQGADPNGDQLNAKDRFGNPLN